MAEKNLHSFIKRLSKQRIVRIKDLANKCFISTSTLYRYTMGSKQINPKMEAVISKALSMTTAEKEEFRKLITITAQDRSLFSSRNILDDLIFARGEAIEEDTKELDFVFYNRNRYLRNSSDLIEDFLKHSKQEKYCCDIKVINCLGEEFQGNLLSMLTQLINATDALSVEHLLEFPKKDYLTCTKNLIAIIPLLNFYKYDVLYNDNPNTHSKPSFLDNVVLVETSWLEEKQKMQQFFVLSYLSDNLSQIAAFKDKYLFCFFINNYQNLRKNYRNAFKASKNILDYSEIFLGMEMTLEEVVLKPNPCYHKIPIQVYDSILERVLPENMKLMQLDSKEGLEKMRSAMEIRYNYAHKTGNIDVLSKDGLLSFAKNGLLFDHLESLPPFNKKERKMILQSLKEYVGKESGYNLYITQNDINNIFLAFKNKCIVIEFSHDHSKKQHNKYPFVIIENKILSEVFFDYATHHVPAYHALPKEEAEMFLDELIDMMDK